MNETTVSAATDMDAASRVGAVVRLGVVVIGRNEAPRLRACLESVREVLPALVYVDSGSSDGSAAIAESLSVPVIRLKKGPFSAARGRQVGFEWLCREFPSVEFVQFVDGDCKLVAGWLERGVTELDCRPDVVAVYGRVRERQPQTSAYNRVCDLDWDRPLGAVDTCGGIAMMRVSAVRSVGGFEPSLIAGEEPELCFRLRQRGGVILRIAPETAYHDAAMHRFGQWWRRAVRTGHAYAEGMARHGHTTARYCVREVRSVLFWGLVLPAAAVSGIWLVGGWTLLLLFGYFGLWWRIYQYQRGRGRSRADARLVATFDTLGKFPQAQGALRYWGNRLCRRTTPLIEYKEGLTD